jgi:molybdopterin molybdotransferase
MISLIQAHQHINNISSLSPTVVSLDKALGLVCAEDVSARTNCPTVDSSLKDGFAVVSADIAEASSNNPVTLTITGAVTAGDDVERVRVISGTAVRIMTGASIPSGATAVLASEFAHLEGELVTIRGRCPFRTEYPA